MQTTHWALLVLIGLSAVAPSGLAQNPAIYAPVPGPPKPKPEKPEEELSPPQVREKYVVRPGEVAGRARATTGDTLRVDQTTFRLWGVVAPPMNAFGGYTAMQGLAALVGGKTVVCTPTGHYLGSQRLARCRSEDRDIATAIVARGWARDCPRQSGGTYALLERRAVVDVAAGFKLPDECLAPY